MAEVCNWERERLLESLDAYTRGVAAAPLVRKWTEATATLESLPSSREERRAPEPLAALGLGGDMTFLVSTDDVDRHGDVIAVDGWHLQAYRRNPVFLWAHNYTSPAIGRAVELWKEDHGLLATVEFAPTQFAQEVAALYRGGYQRGVSVGFRPLRYELRRHPNTGDLLGVKFLEQELLEISAAPVPANQSALRKALDNAPVTRGYYKEGAAGGLEEVLAVLRGAREH